MEVKREHEHIYRVVFSDEDLERLGVISKALNQDIEDFVFLILDVTIHELIAFLLRKDG